MAKLLIILFSPGTRGQNTETVYELSKAAVEANHEVAIFFDADASRSLLAKQMLPGKPTPAGRISELIEMGIPVLACKESARMRGIDTKRDLIHGVVESSLGRMAELMEQHDRIVAFG